MGHITSILTFPADAPKSKISYECDEWARANGSYEEGCRSLPYPIRFTNRTFSSYEEAEEYLEKTFGNYSEIAVKYVKLPEPKRTKTLDALEKRASEAWTSARELDSKPHYAGVKQATVKCRTCGSSLSTKYCGRTYRNQCPVCRGDLRPASTIERIRKKKEEAESLQKRYMEERRKAQMKSSAKPEIRWAVGCEVHF